MLFQKRVKGGLLLYALLMLSIFLLLLQFYLNRQVAQARNHQASPSALVAYGMAHWTKEKVNASHQFNLVATNPEEKLVEEEASNLEAVAEPDKTDEVTEPERVEEEALSPRAPAEEEGENNEPNSIKKAQPKLPETGQVKFNEGYVDYYLKGHQLSTKVYLLDGKVFYYDFHINSENT